MRPALALLLALGAGALAGCGLGAGKGASGVSITVSRNFGAHRLGLVRESETRGSDTVMRLLQRSFRVRTRFGGGFVQAIDGVAGGERGGRPYDWFYYVNGVQAPKGAAATPVRSGDAILWDYHDWGAANSIPAIVGAFPEPFAHGIAGKRRPLHLECAPGAGTACRVVQARLAAQRLAPGRAALGTGGGTQTLRILVGRWTQLRSDPVAAQLARGPGVSGVYVRPAGGGGRLAVLDPRGRTARVLGAGTGLIAATRVIDQQPAWVVTGTDDAGVRAAAAALTPAALRGRFAAVVAGGRVVSAPEVGA